MILIKTLASSGHLAALFTIFIWGTTFISTKILLIDFQPLEILFIRFALGFICLKLAVPRFLPFVSYQQELYFAAAGLSGICLYYLLENIALTYTLAANVGVIICVSPLFTAIINRILHQNEPLSLKFLISCCIAITGVSCISFSGQETLALNPLGDILALLAALTWSIYALLTKKISSYGYNSIQATAKTFAYGLIFMLPTMYFLPFKLHITTICQPINLINLLFLGIGASAACFVTWNIAVKNLGAVKTSLYIYLVPIITITTSAIILHEQITLLAILGTILTLLGLFLSQTK